LNEHLASVALKQFPITLLIAARAKHRGFKTEEQELAYNLHVIGASQLHMQWGVTLSSFRQDQASHDNRAGLSRHREQALDELALAGEDSSLRRQLRITSRSNWAKDRSTLSVSRPSTDKNGPLLPFRGIAAGRVSVQLVLQLVLIGAAGAPRCCRFVYHRPHKQQTE
jgi:hypothetical protein